MHYLFIHTASEWSGTARAFVTAARGLAKRGHTVTVAAEPDSTVERVMSQESITAGGATLFHVVPLSQQGTWIGVALRLRSLARKRGVSVVFVHTDWEYLVAVTAFLFGSRARIVRRVPTGQTVSRRLRQAPWFVPTCFLFASEPDLRATPLPRRAVAAVAALGVNTPDVAPDTAAAGGTTDSMGEYIVCVHDTYSRSRAAAAIRTMAMLAPLHPDLRLVITGESSYDDDLRMQTAALGVLHLVTFLGDRADELHVMRGARLGWIVADGDTAAYGILDLMALGVPVLASAETVAQRYILSSITGLLLPSDDTYLAAAGIAELLSSDAQRHMMGQAARVRVARDFPESAMIDGFEYAASDVTAPWRRSAVNL